ncbi:protein RKD2-like [Curcuma longa]|uniref:protein RKD2-like n=1 Tax=Curcuma longa TaxID=136217 RepID=UPI003D9DC84D
MENSLSTQSLEWVKQFLINYDIERLRESCVMLQDSLSAFCDALCVRLSDAGSAGDLSRPPCTADVQQAALRTPPPKPPHELGTGGSATRRPDLDIATQRERTRRLDLKEVANYVHLPITEAAKELRICPTALKKVCRRHGLPRWPFRKVRSLEREILNLQKELRPGTAAEAENIRAKIDRLVDEKARICRRDCS